MKQRLEQQYAQPALLFWNARGGNKASGFQESGEAIFKPIVGRGSAFADLEGDGDLDVVISQIAGPPLLLRNDQQLNHHWVRFKLVGRRCNRDAIGAWIKLRVGTRTLAQQVMPTRGYLSQSELPVTFGLGDSDQIQEVTIRWPNGREQRVPRVKIDALNIIEEGLALIH